MSSIGNPFTYELQLFGRFGSSQKVTKIGKNIFLLLDAVSLISLTSMFDKKYEIPSFYHKLLRIYSEKNFLQYSLLMQDLLHHERKQKTDTKRGTYLLGFFWWHSVVNCENYSVKVCRVCTRIINIAKNA